MTFDEYVKLASEKEGIGKDAIRKYFEAEGMFYVTSLEGLVRGNGENDNEDENYDYVYGQTVYEAADPVWEAECNKRFDKLEYLEKHNKKEYKKYKEKLQRLFADYVKDPAA